MANHRHTETFRWRAANGAHSTQPALHWPGEVPFFQRLWVRIGSGLALFVALMIAVLMAQQLRDTLGEIQRGAVGKGRTLAFAMLPLIQHALDTDDTDEMQQILTRVCQSEDIDYVQVIEADGSLRYANSPLPNKRLGAPLSDRWLPHLAEKSKPGHRVLVHPWSGDNADRGVDVFVPLLSNPEKADFGALYEAQYLRIGVNFNSVSQTDLPRLYARVALYTLLGTVLVVAGLLTLVRYILRPLRELQLGLRALAAGDLDYELPVKTRDELGRVAEVFNVTATRLRSAFEQIEALATHDHLTGLANRRAFDECLAVEAARSRRYGHPFGLIILDLDNFKQVNDTYGHPTGDEVLKQVAGKLASTVRETDFAARIGGEEFAVLLPETPSKDIFTVAEKIRVAIMGVPILSRGNPPQTFTVTISAGGVGASGPLVLPEALLAAADAALYRSKQNGRNRVTIASPLESSILRRVRDPEPAQNVVIELPRNETGERKTGSA